MTPAKKIRFAVVGLGNIAQMAVLPAFANAKDRCQLVALVSSDEEKRAKLGKEYQVEHTGGYDQMEQLFQRAEVDAAYIALPNSMHHEFTLRCAKARVHVLCEKPMALTVEECEAMIRGCEENDVKLMIAYRLHFDAGNLEAVEAAQSGQIGELRYFSSLFGQQVREGDIRTKKAFGGGALFDMGTYCVNAARYLFRGEPSQVVAFESMGHDARSQEVDESTTALLRFSEGRMAQFTASQGSADVSEFQIVGTTGDLRLDPAFTYHGEMKRSLTVKGETKTHTYPVTDQFAPELLHFAECVASDTEPEPSGREGLADIRILQAIKESIRTNKPVDLPPFPRARRPGKDLMMKKPAVKKPLVVNAPPPTTKK